MLSGLSIDMNIGRIYHESVSDISSLSMSVFLIITGLKQYSSYTTINSVSSNYNNPDSYYNSFCFLDFGCHSFFAAQRY